VSTESSQRDHYDAIASQYEAHYDDAASQRYRDSFINDAMFAGILLQDTQVLEAMCGSGQTTRYLVGRGARVTGLDISARQVEAFERRWAGCRGVRASILESDLDSDSFDCVVVVGGLHHVHPYVKEAVSEIHRLLKVGGYFCFMEPHARSFPDRIRQFWYKRDPLFNDNEAAIDVARLKRDFADEFTFRRESYRGNLAYLFVLNSLVFRAPLSLKRAYSPALLRIESVLQPFQRRSTSCFAVCQWQKK
jgi:SAM-dependent methyltransferase